VRHQEHPAPKENPMLFVIKNLDTGKYAARHGLKPAN
jgi:hypothetical protein